MRDLTGQKYGELTVSYHEYRVGGTGRKYTGYVCVCSCGRSVWVRSEDLRHGKQVTCGKGCTRKVYASIADYLANTVLVDACFEWRGPFTTQGYGRIGQAPNCKYIHREVFRMANGYDPEVVMHTCDNRKCVNPAHLQGGTHKDNFADMRVKRRQAYGERVGVAKLDAVKVREIRRKREAGISISALAREYTVARATILSVCNKTTWRHI